MPRRRRSFSYSRPVSNSASTSRSRSRTPSLHRLPQRNSPRHWRRMSRSPSYSPTRPGIWGRSFSRSRSRSRLRSPIRQADRYVPQRRNYAKSPEIGTRRHLSRSVSRDRYRRSRSRVRRPQQEQTRESGKAAASSKRGGVSRKSMDMFHVRRDSLRSGQGIDFLEPGEVSASEFIQPSRPIRYTQPKPVKFASSIKLSEAIVSSLVSPPQSSQLPESTQTLQRDTSGTAPLCIFSTAMELHGDSPSQRWPSDSDMEVDDYLGMKSGDDEVVPLAYSNKQDHILRISGASEPRNVQECIHELAQALVRSKTNSEYQDHVSSGDEGPAQSGSKPAYGDSAVRRCEQMITAMINDALLQFKMKSEIGPGHVQGIERGCSRCDSLEQRINALEQQKLEEATRISHMEERMEKKMEQMIEARAVKPVRNDESEAILPPTKRRRLDAPPVPTSLFSNEEASEGAIALRLAQLESTVSMWEKRLTDILAVGDNASAPTGEGSKSMVDRINTLESDSKQVFGYLSVHHSALASLNSALSLDPSKPLGQGLHRHLSNLRAEMAHMLTDVFGSLEDSFARLIVGVIIKQTKLEMRASCDWFADELLSKIAPGTLTKGKEPPASPTIASSSILTLEGLNHAISPDVALPAIEEPPSKSK